MLDTRTRILGLDPGLCHLGWGVVDWDSVRLTFVACGTVNTAPPASLAERLAVLFEGLETVIREWQPLEAAVEETFVNSNAQSALRLGQARGIALLAPARFGLKVAEYAPNTIKKTIVGAGHAEKEQLRVMLKHLLPRATPQSQDAADALGVAITHAYHRKARALVEKHAPSVQNANRATR